MVECGVGRVVDLVDVVVGGDQACPVRVSVDELARIGVSGRDDDAAPMDQGDVKRQQCRLLPAVRGVGRRVAGIHLVGQLAVGPEAAQRIDERAQLGCGRAESRGRPEDHRIGPHDVVAGGRGKILGGFIIGGPRRVLGERGRIVSLGDVPYADFGARRFGCRRDALGHRRSMAGGGVVNDRQLRHRVIVGTGGRRTLSVSPAPLLMATIRCARSSRSTLALAASACRRANVDLGFREARPTCRAPAVAPRHC